MNENEATNPSGESVSKLKTENEKGELIAQIATATQVGHTEPPVYSLLLTIDEGLHVRYELTETAMAMLAFTTSLLANARVTELKAQGKLPS